MKTKNIFKTLAFAMLMPTMLLTTSCSSDDDFATNNANVNNTENIATKGYELPATINVTRQDTRATFDDGTKKLSFSSGDKLFVQGTEATAGSFAGTLTWVSEGTFSGTIYTENAYSGTADALLTAAGGGTAATLLPNGYESTGFLYIGNNGTEEKYDDQVAYEYSEAFALTKAAGVEQLSYEQAGWYGSGFTLSPHNPILNFTITGLPASTEVAVVFSYYATTVNKNVTTNGSGTATFAIGVSCSNLADCSLTVGGNVITLVNSSKTLTAGTIYNVSRSVPEPPAGALPGKFTINGSGNKVMFSQGNLRANFNTSWTWSFFPDQWGYVGNASNNTNITGNGTVSTASDYLYVDLFGWVGASSSWTDAAKYGISKSTATNAENGYGTSATEALKSDWGNVDGISSGWRTLTSAEWGYIFTERTTGGTVFGTSQARYAHATIRTDISGGVNGMILFPDGVSIAASEVTTAGTVNDTSAWGTKCTSAQWTALAAKGCVFLPAAGEREAATATHVGSYGHYWSSSPDAYNVNGAYAVKFESGILYPQNTHYRNYGFSVRLVRAVE